MTIWHQIHRISHAVGFIFFLMANIVCSVASAADHKQVMLLHSFGREVRPWSDYAQSIHAELKRQSPWPLDITDHSLISARSSDEDPEVPFVEYLSALFSKRPLDLIVSVGAPAAAFVQRHRQKLFTTTPMVLSVLEQRRVQYSILTENDTVVPVRINYPAAIGNILQVLPDTRSVAVVVGASPIEQFWREEIRKDVRPFTDRIAFTFWDSMSFEDILKKAAALPPHSAIFWELMIVDAAGVVHEGDEAFKRLHAVANAPIFGYYEPNLGQGVVGGPFNAVLDSSRETAAVAVRILGGEKPGDIRIPPLEFAAPKFDWRQMQRWQISESRLPPGSEIVSRAATVWEQYHLQILVAIAALVFQAVLICWLILEHRRRNLAEIQSRNSMTELTYMNRRATAGELSASIAHEVNQPLTGIVTRANAARRWVRAENPDLEKVHDALEQIASAGHRAANIVTSIRTMFKKDSTQRAPTDVNGLIRTVLAIVRIELERNKVDIQTHLDEQLPSVQGDKVQLQQVVLNLVMNAIDAMQTVYWRQLTVRTQVTAENVVVSVEDTGTGIDEAKLDQLFKPLFTTKSHGMGMGLAICQSIVENHDGRIRASLRATRGSIVQFELPIQSH